MTVHLFKIGSIVSLNFSDGQSVPRSSFKVEAQLPPLGSSLQYRIKSEAEGFSRVVVEHQLSLTGAGPRPAIPVSPRVHKGEED